MWQEIKDNTEKGQKKYVAFSWYNHFFYAQSKTEKYCLTDPP